MTTLRRRMREDPPRRGLALKPQECSIAVVHQRAQRYRRVLDQLSKEDLC